ncbi:hypothetical protein [uncultured Polaribacter sp.]|uniref:hypothetical protein n=1 Tax=uncultured Polaribacter sp. TaxID=174711 RepID=UPI002622FFA2|nr:hypothetical protein [uncultured Polaribacter sp.]
MQAKWYFSTFFLIFIYFGAFQEQVSIPNQEIVLEFVDANINEKDIEKSIAEVKEKLLKVGITNIVIHKSETSTLKISYFSKIDIKNIREILSKENQLVLNANSPYKDNSTNYNFDVYELNDATQLSNVDKKFVFDIKYNSDRFTTVNYSTLIKNLESSTAEQLYKTAYKANKNSPFTKDKTSCKEPEVRAGPKFYLS